MKKSLTIALATSLYASAVHASVVPDRTRIIFDGQQKSMILTVKNGSKGRVYLAQSWMEDVNGNKKNLPLVVTQPLLRVESGSQTHFTLTQLPAAAKLPQDRESLFFYNVRGIPPKTEQQNSLQIAVQTSIKTFYRPAALMKQIEKEGRNWHQKLQLQQQGERITAKNPTPFYIVISNAQDNAGRKVEKTFASKTIAPFSSEVLPGRAASYGSAPQLEFINDFGGKGKINFRCQSGSCNAITQPG